MLDCDELPVDCCYENESNPDELCITPINNIGGLKTQIYVLNVTWKT